MLERANPRASDVFPAMFPTPTAGDGRVRQNNLRKPTKQPKAIHSERMKMSCRQCGFICDLSRQAPSGGDLGGDGAFASISITSTSAGYSGEGQLSSGSGCPLCGSKNFSASRAGHISQGE